MSDMHTVRQNIEEAMRDNDQLREVEGATVRRVGRVGDAVLALVQRLDSDLASLEGLGDEMTTHVAEHMAEIDGRRVGIEAGFATAMMGARPDALAAVAGNLSEARQQEVGAAEAARQMGVSLAYAARHLRVALAVLTPGHAEGGQFALWQSKAADALQASINTRGAANMAATEYLVGIQAAGQGEGYDGGYGY